MNLNYLAFFLIAFIPLVVGYFWFNPKFVISKKNNDRNHSFDSLSTPKLIILYLLSLILVYGYINLIIHQMGFYELFFTDIIKGNQDSELIVKEFLRVYGEKHRHFGHGVFHGIINSFMIALPFIGIFSVLENRSKKFVLHHLSYWLITSPLIGGCIAQFV